MKTHRTLKISKSRLLCRFLFAVGLLGGVLAANAELVLRYNFDEENGEILDSGAVPAANGTLVGQAGRINNTPSGTGYALDVVGSNNGINNYVSTGNPDKLNNLNNAITLTWWMNLKSLPAQSDRIVEKLAAGGGFGARFGLPSGGRTSMSLGVNATSTGAVSPAISNLNTWIFVAVTYDCTKTADNVQWFIGDQTSVSATPGPVTYNRGVITNTANEFRVGSTAASSADRTPLAWIDDVRVYNTVLSAEEIEQIRIEGGGSVPTAPAITSFDYNAAGYLSAGANISINATVSGKEPLTAIWQRNGITLSEGVTVGNTSPLSLSYTVENLVPDNAGQYTLVITNVFGAVTSAPVNLSATTLYSTEVLTNLWTLDPAYFYLTNNSAERSMAYSPVSSYYPAGSLLVPHFFNLSDFGIAILNAENGSYDGYFLPISDGGGVSVSSGTRAINSIAATEDGVIYVGNLTTSATNVNGAYFLYRYTSDNASALPSIAYTGDPGGPNYPGLRWGDNLALRGTGNNTELLIAPAGDLAPFQTWQTNIVTLFRTTDGIHFAPTVIRITNGPTALANNGLAFGPGTNTFLAKKFNEPLRLIEFDVHSGLGWVKHEYDLDTIPGCVTAVALNADATRLGALSVETPDNFRFYKVNKSIGTPELLDQESFSNNPNPVSGGLGAVAFGKNGIIYVLDTANGIKAFGPNSAYIPPAGFSIGALTPDPRGMALSWPAEAGKTYQALSSDSLNPARWSPVGLPVIGNGSTASATNLFLEEGRTQRFYRVRGQ